MRFLLFLISFLLNSLLALGWPPDSSPCRSDFDGDGLIGMSDLLLMLADFGATRDRPTGASPTMWFTESLQPRLATGYDSNYEFLELINADSVPVNLAGWSLTEGFDFTFPEDSWLQPGNMPWSRPPCHLCRFGRPSRLALVA